MLSIEGLEIEIVIGLSRERDGEFIESLREGVLLIAAISRGWTSADEIDAFRSVFNIDPLYQASSLALIRSGKKLVGIVGVVNEWHVEQGSIVHLCSLGFLPEAQGRNLMTLLMGPMWSLTLQNPRNRRDFEAGRVYFTAITQSPYIIGYLHRFADMVPSPYRAIGPDHVGVARHVVARFDPHLELEEDTLILRGEADFHYRDFPLSTDRKINQFCQEQLDYGRGDVFVGVGRVPPARVHAVLRRIRSVYPALADIPASDASGRDTAEARAERP